MKQKDIEYYMNVACLTAERSYAQRAKVGAIIVKDGSIISEGYNGTFPGKDNCCETEDGKHTLPGVIHAEKNAVMKLTRSTISSKGSVLFVTHEPCMECASLIILAGIKTVYYKISYESQSFKSGICLLNDNNIEVIKI